MQIKKEKYKNGRHLCPPFVSGKNHTINKIFFNKDLGTSCLSNELVNVPLKVLLEYTFTLNSVLIQNSIDSALSSGGLPTTIIKSDGVVTNLGNLVAMKMYNCHITFMGDSGVSTAEVATFDDRLVHQGFNLTHGRFGW